MSRAIAVSRGSVGEDASKAGWGQTLSQAMSQSKEAWPFAGGRERVLAGGHAREPRWRGAASAGSESEPPLPRVGRGTWSKFPPSDPPRFHLQCGRTASSPGDGENQSTLCGAVLAPLL